MYFVSSDCFNDQRSNNYITVHLWSMINDRGQNNGIAITSYKIDGKVQMIVVGDEKLNSM